jgi:hypothetical protein
MEGGIKMPFWEVGDGMEYPRYGCETMQEFIGNIHTLKGFGFEVDHCDITPDSLYVQLTKRIPERNYSINSKEWEDYRFVIGRRKYGVIYTIHRSDDPSGVGCVADMLSLLGIQGRLGAGRIG